MEALSDPAFARGHTSALRIAIGLAAVALVVAAATFRPVRVSPSAPRTETVST